MDEQQQSRRTVSDTCIRPLGGVARPIPGRIQGLRLSESQLANWWLRVCNAVEVVCVENRIIVSDVCSISDCDGRIGWYSPGKHT